MWRNQALMEEIYVGPEASVWPEQQGHKPSPNNPARLAVLMQYSEPHTCPVNVCG